ncbi:MAG TPA: DUF6232 family protein [Longimicrobium sp.]
MSTLNAIADRIAQPEPEKQEYDHGFLKIRRKTLVIGNAIYPIDNISTITLSDLRNPVPKFVWIMLGVGVLGLVMGDSMAVVGALLIAAAGYLIYLNRKSRSAADYSLSVQMNSGYRAMVMSDNGAFLKSIALELHGVIEYQRASNSTYNLHQSVRIDSITGSTVGVTGIQGDIVNHVPAI